MFWILIKGVLGSRHDWVLACCQARDSDWTLNQVIRVLNLTYLVILLGFLILAVLMAVSFSFLISL